MGNNLFYKALAAISTVGVLVLAGTSLVPEASDKANELDELIAKTKREVIEARKDALAEVNAVRKNALNEVKAARREALESLKEAGGGSQGTAHMILTGYVNGSSSSVIPMKDMDQCEEQGVMWMSSTRARFHLKYKGFECLESR